MIATVKGKVSEAEQIEAGRPLITWIQPAKIASIARWFLRRQWGFVHRETQPQTGSLRVESANIILLSPGIADGHIGNPNSTVIRFWYDGRLVITGPLKEDTLDAIAKLRVSSEADYEDNCSPGYRNDSRLRHAPLFLVD